MRHTIRIADHCGSFCSGGEAAASLRVLQIEQHLADAEEIELDFGGVRNMNSSFCNTLIGGLARRFGSAVVRYVRFTNCNPTVRIHLRSALSMGLAAFSQEHSANTAGAR